MDLRTLLQQLTAKNVTLSVEQGRLKFLAPKGALTPLEKALLREHKQQLIQMLASRPRTTRAPLTHAQQLLWFAEQLNPGSNVYYICTTYAFSGPLDIACLKAALSSILHRQDALRTSFVTADPEPYQQVTETVELPFSYYDESQLTSDQLHQRLTVIQKKTRLPLDKAPLCHFNLIKSSEGHYLLNAIFHHLIMDGWSVALFVKELSEAYSALVNDEEYMPPPVEMGFLDYAAWQRSQLTDAFLQERMGFWQELLVDYPETTIIPADYKRPAQQSYVGASLTFTIPSELHQRIKRTAQGNGVTVNSVLMSAYTIFLQHYTGQADLLFGTPATGRNRREIEATFGMFVNTLPFRVRIDQDDTFSTLLQRVNIISARTQSNAAMPFASLLDQLRANRRPDMHALFQSIYNYLPPIDADLCFNGLDFKPVTQEVDSAKFDFSFYFEEVREGIAVAIEYATELYCRQTVERWAANFVRILEIVTEQADIPVKSLCILSDAERQGLQELANGPATSATPLSFLEHFRLSVGNHPNLTAVCDGKASLTYRQLDELSNRIAHSLMEKGATKGCVVAAAMGRSAELIATLVGILKTGAVYLFLDLDLPANRLSHIIKDSAVRLVITTSTEVPAEVIPYRLDYDQITNGSDQPTGMPPGVDAHSLLVYTSGTTGMPKGTLLSTRGHNSLFQLYRDLGVLSGDRIGQMMAPSFDGFMMEVLCCLALACELHILPDQHKLDPQAIKAWIEQESINNCTLTTLLGEQLFAMEWDAQCPLKSLITGGEVLKSHPPRPLPFKAVNVYGPTENSVVTTYAVLESGLPYKPAIGRPLANISCHILNAHLIPVPMGAYGELCVGGSSLAVGYLNRPELEQKKFIHWSPLSFQIGREQPDAIRLYRTGDLVRYRPDGSIEFFGRMDNQVKLRGFRIELEEIESHLLKFPGIRAAKAEVQEYQGEKFLVAFLEGNPGLGRQEIVSHLSLYLPGYMIPSHVSVLEKMPVTNNGKIDTRALPCPFHQKRNAPASHSPGLEDQLLEIWREVLHQDAIATSDSFFAVGGNSLQLPKVRELIQQRLKFRLELLDLFRYHTIDQLAAYLQGGGQLQADTTALVSNDREAIAVIGMAGRFPGSEDIGAMWNNLLGAKECVTFFSKQELTAAGVPPELAGHEDYVPANGVLDHAYDFDNDFFTVSPRETEIMDPQQRVLLEAAHNTMEDAGYVPAKYQGRVGVFVGTGTNGYFLQNILRNNDSLQKTGQFGALLLNERDFAPTRISYKLNLRGPSVSVSTACSTSLVAVHLAANALADHQCDMALAGGAKVMASQVDGYLYEPGGILSPDGHCRAFDAKANGTIGGNGVGMVLLKRLSDAVADRDHIYCLIKSSATNNDGNDKIGYTAPSVSGQAEVIRLAAQRANVSPASIGLVETHGTGTELGDPIEMAALQDAFGQNTQHGFCALGSAKPNFGHLDTAAGITGFIKAAKSVQTGIIPPLCNFTSPNKKLNLKESPFYIPVRQEAWRVTGYPRRAAVSSFGIGGTNAHAILEQAPPVDHAPSPRRIQLITLSARTPQALEQRIDTLIAHLTHNPEVELADVAYTLNTGRAPMRYRISVVARDIRECLEKLSERRSFPCLANDAPNRIVFLFTGQGSQRIGMAKGLYDAEPFFKDIVDHCCATLLPIMGIDLRDRIWPSENTVSTQQQLSDMAVVQPALFIIEYALARLLIHWGLSPEILTGHSLGEWVAACISGVYNLEDSLRLMEARGRLMKGCKPGSMLITRMNGQEAQQYLHERLCIAGLNSPEQTVFSGPIDAITALQQQLNGLGHKSKLLNITHAAHSFLLDPAVDPFRQAVRSAKAGRPRIPIITNVTGTWLDDDEAGSDKHWANQLRHTVRFTDGLDTLLAEDNLLLLEVGAERVLSELAMRHPRYRPEIKALSTLRRPRQGEIDEMEFFETIGAIWEAGNTIDWQAMYQDEKRRRVSLPGYPFERKTFYVAATPADACQPSRTVGSLPGPPQTTHRIPGDGNGIVAAITSAMASLLGQQDFGINDDFFAAGGDSLLAVQLAVNLREQYGIRLPKDALYQYPVARELAKVVVVSSQAAHSDKDYSNPQLLRLVAGNEKPPPLFLIHAVGGGALIYRDFLKAFGNASSVYGISSRGLLDNSTPLTTVEEMADAYLEMVNAVAPKQRVVLGGCSFGGYVAHEMALRMKEYDVEPLATLLFDTPSPQFTSRKITTDDELYAYFLDGDDIGANFKKTLSELQSLEPEPKQHYLLDKMRQTLPGMQNLRMTDLERMLTVLQHNIKAMQAYQPRPAAMKLTYFRAMEMDLFNDQTPEAAWLRLAPAGFEVIPVGGNHASMLSLPHVQTIVSSVQRILAAKAG